MRIASSVGLAGALLLIGLFLGLPTAQAQDSDGWPMEDEGAARTSYENETNVHTDLLPWLTPISCERVRLAYHNGSIYGTCSLPDRSGIRVFGVSAVNGGERWITDLEDISPQPPVAGSGVVVVSGHDIHALDAETGDVLWSFSRDETSQTTVALGPDSVFARFGPDLYSLDIRTGEIQWLIPGSGTDHPARLSPVLNGEHLFLASLQGEGDTVGAINITSKEIAWRFQAPGGVGSVATDGRSLFFGTSEDQFYSLKARTGELDWRITLNETTTSHPVVLSENVVFETGDSIKAVNKSDGTETWITEGSDACGFVAAPQRLYLCHGDSIQAHTHDTGRLVWQTEISHISRMIGADGVLFYTTIPRDSIIRGGEIESMQPQRPNFRLSNLSITPENPQPKAPIAVNLSVQNLESQRATGTLELIVDNRVVQNRTVELTANESSVFEFDSFSISASGSHQVWVKAPNLNQTPVETLPIGVLGSPESDERDEDSTNGSLSGTNDTNRSVDGEKGEALRGQGNGTRDSESGEIPSEDESGGSATPGLGLIVVGLSLLLALGAQRRQRPD